MRKIIAFCGYARSGKDTAAAVLVEQGWQRVAFADAVRDFALVINPWIGVESIRNNYEGALYTEIPLCRHLREIVSVSGWDDAKKNPHVRQLLIDIGMGGREKLFPTIWMDVVRRKIEATESDIVLTDCRFPNEAEMIHGMGGKVVRIDRPGIEPQGAPDLAVDEIKFDGLLVNDKTVEELRGCVKLLIEDWF